MQSVSANYTNAADALARNVAYKLEIKWDGSNWVDETAYLDLTFSGKLRIAAPADDLVPPGDIGSFEFKLMNHTGRFTDAGSPIYSYISGPVGALNIETKMSVSMYPSEWVTIFTGVIANWTPTDAIRQVSVTARDVGWKYLQYKMSTSVFKNKLTSEWITYLAASAGITNRTIDTGMYRIPYVWLDDESAVEEIWKVAQSEGGRVFFDQLGKLHFETITNWVSRMSSLMTISVWDDISPSSDAESIVSKVICEYANRVPGSESVLYTLDTVRIIRPGETVDIEAKFNTPADRLIVPVGTSAKDYYISSSAGYDMLASIVVSLPNIYGQRATIRVANTHTKLTAVIHKMQLRGNPIVGGTQEEAEVAAVSPTITNRVRTISGNTYVQSESQATSLATVMAERLKKLTLSYHVAGIPGRPQLELGDYITVAGRTKTVTGWITEIAFHCEDGQFVQDLDVLDSTGFFSYANYFVIGTTALGGGRAWH